MMAIYLLLVVIGAVAAGFIYATLALSRYLKKIHNEDKYVGGILKEKLPHWHTYFRLALPIIIVGFAFNAVCAVVGVFYIFLRILEGW